MGWVLSAVIFLLESAGAGRAAFAAKGASRRTL